MYVAARGLKTQKFSLHESGDWFYGWVDAETALKHTGHTKRFFLDWKRPDAVSGWSPAIEARVPHGHLSENPEGDDRVIYLPEAAAGRMSRIHLALAVPNDGEVPGSPVDGFTLLSGEAVVVLYSEVEFPEEQREWLTTQLRKFILDADQVKQTLEANHPRIMLNSSNDHRMQVVWDLRIARSGEG